MKAASINTMPINKMEFSGSGTVNTDPPAARLETFNGALWLAAPFAESENRPLGKQIGKPLRFDI